MSKSHLSHHMLKISSSSTNEAANVDTNRKQQAQQPAFHTAV